MKVFSDSHVGKRRRNNEDSFRILQLTDKLYVFMVADGVGGEKKGEVASELTIHHIEEYFKNNFYEVLSSLDDEGKIIRLIKNAIHYSNNIVRELSLQEEFYMMATTIVMALVYESEAFVANVGDSRCYLFGEKGLFQITKDHTFVQELIDKELITLEEAKTHQEKSWITRAIGLEIDVEIDFYKHTLEKDDLLILCSDGLNSMLDDEEIEEIIKKHITVEYIVSELIQKALDKGGLDNVTVLCAKNVRL